MLVPFLGEALEERRGEERRGEDSLVLRTV
jgi:hypothetical protein